MFDVVEVADRPADAPGRMVVGQVRLYSDGTYKYSVGNVDVEDDDDWGGLYGEDQLRATGTRVDVSLYEIPGPFDHRDIVLVSESHEDPELQGESGVVEGWVSGNEPETVAVWFEDIGRADLVRPEDLIATGSKAPRPSPGQPATSQKVGTDGSLLGIDEYVLVDDLSFHL